jgi:nicotinate phosphoribosyltransferase
MADEIKAQSIIYARSDLTKEELDYLRSIRFIKDDYVEFLRLWHPIRDYVTIDLSDEGELSVVVDGPLFSAISLRSICLRSLTRSTSVWRFDYEALRRSAEERLDAKIKAMNDGTYTFRFAEFGCRRRPVP